MEWDTKEQYRHRDGQKGMEIYRLKLSGVFRERMACSFCWVAKARSSFSWDTR